MAKPGGIILSVCIPTYNRPECIERALAHYLAIISENNLGGKVEICISDNSANRETESVVGEFANKLDIRYSRNRENLGYDRNVILAISLASGKFVQLAGDELFYRSQSLKEAVGVLEAGKCDAIMFDDDNLFPQRGGRPFLEVDGKSFWQKALSYEWTNKRSITHIDYVAIRNSDFGEYLKFLGKKIEALYGLTFIQLSFYSFALKRSDMVYVLGPVNDPSAVNAPKKVGVYFPSDDARVFYYKYYFEFKECFNSGILDAPEFSRFKMNFFLSSANHLLRIRTHMYPRIYGKEEAETLKHIRLVEREYGGIKRAILSIYRGGFFIGIIPYHFIYLGFVFFRNKILRKPRESAIELYERCLNEKEGRGALYKTDF